MSKPVIRKHSAKVLSCTMNGHRKFWAFIGGKWYYAGNSELGLSPHLQMPNGLWRDSITRILQTTGAFHFRDLARFLKEEGATKIQIAIHEWTSENEKPLFKGIPF